MQTSSHCSLLQTVHRLLTAMWSNLLNLVRPSRLPCPKVVFPLLGISHLSSLVCFPPNNLSSPDSAHFTCVCVLNVPFKWKLHEGRDLCALLTVGSLASRAEPAQPTSVIFVTVVGLWFLVFAKVSQIWFLLFTIES